ADPPALPAARGPARRHVGVRRKGRADDEREGRPVSASVLRASDLPRCRHVATCRQPLAPEHALAAVPSWARELPPRGIDRRWMVNLRDRDDPSRGMSRAVALQADVLSAGIVKTLPLGASNQQAKLTANVYSSRRHAACRTGSRIVTLAGAI